MFPVALTSSGLESLWWRQFLGGIITLIISLVTGALTGFIANKLGNPDHLYMDDDHWMHVEYPAGTVDEKDYKIQ